MNNQQAYSSGYRYGFNGQEGDGEIYGDKLNYAFQCRMYDARIGRFWSVDPLRSDYPWNSTYAFAKNDVIQFIDLEGLEKGVRTQSSNRVQNYRNNSNYAKNAYGLRYPSYRTIKTSTANISRTQLSNGFREIVTTQYNYLITNTSIEGTQTQTTSNLPISVQIFNLLGDYASIKITRIQDQLNTSNGIVINKKTAFTFTNPNIQQKFDELQKEYERKFEGLIDNMEDVKPDDPDYINIGNFEFNQSLSKANKAGKILGPSPYSIMLNIILNTKNEINVKEVTIKLPEIYSSDE